MTQDAKGYIFYEAKFRKEPITSAMINNEIQQVEATGLNCYQYGFISRAGFDLEPGENMIFIELKELYNGLE